jgi:hypothetical protein
MKLFIHFHYIFVDFNAPHKLDRWTRTTIEDTIPEVGWLFVRRGSRSFSIEEDEGLRDPSFVEKAIGSS